LIDLGNFRKFISIDTIENLEGKLNGNIHFQAGFKNSSFSRRNIENFQISGNAIIQDAELKLKNSGYLYNDINCQITLGYDFLIENLSLRIDDNDFDIQRFWRENNNLVRVRQLLSGKLEGVCNQCIFESSCKGYCRALAYEEASSFLSPHPWCQSAFENGVFPNCYLNSEKRR
jgi:radical SAM protein with 4Fe4S-binding SPASM domain